MSDTEPTIILRTTMGEKKPVSHLADTSQLPPPGDTRNFRDPLDSVRGSLRELRRRTGIEQQINYLNTIILPLCDTYGSLRAVMGGNTSLHEKASNFPTDAFTPFISRQIVKPISWPADNSSGIRVKKTFATPWNTGVDYDPLVQTQGEHRIKFYLSTDTSTPEKMELARQFGTELMERVFEQKLSLMTKLEDHDYDNPDLYTWHPEEMQIILAELYKKYPTIWKTTPHILQGTVSGVNPDHMGWVQEPLNQTEMGIRLDSHSGRMYRLGKYIEAHLEPGQRISTDIYIAACKAADVQPQAPWLVALP